MSDTRGKTELVDDPGVVSPVGLEPAWRCGKAVAITGHIPFARIDIERDGVVWVSNVRTEPSGARALIELPERLGAGQRLRARQRFGDAVSAWSAAQVVRDSREDYPAGLPQPRISPGPVYRCGAMSGVENILTGSEMVISANGNVVGRQPYADSPTATRISPQYEIGQEVIAWATLCDEQVMSRDYFPEPPPATLPQIEFYPVHEGARTVSMRNILPGARVRLSRNGVALPERPHPGPGWGFGLAEPVTRGETLSATQRLCAGDGSSEPGLTTVLPCSTLPGAGAWPPQRGDTSVRLHTFVPGGRVQVYADGVKIGDGSGPVVQLTRAVRGGETLRVVQKVGDCTSSQILPLDVHCVSPPFAESPAALDLFPVGEMDYDNGDILLTTGFNHRVAGVIRYPGQWDGVDAPFHERLGALVGRAPLAVFVHGRWGHPESYLGYRYIQEQLARMGIVSVSVDCNAADNLRSGDDMLDRSELIFAAIRHMLALDRGEVAGHEALKGKIDFSRTCLFGHSRGGEAVLLAAETVNLPRVKIAGVISLAPVDTSRTSGSPRGFAFMTLLPAADGDVVNNEGAKFYDRAEPSPFKSQVYIHSANHNFFNRTWWRDEGLVSVMDRESHEAILSAYCCAFFRAVQLGHDTLGFLDGRLRPLGVQTTNCHLSFRMARQVVVDDHEAGDGIEVNTLGQPARRLDGDNPGEYSFMQGFEGRYNDSFYHFTRGMVISDKKKVTWRTALGRARSLDGKEIWIRAADVYEKRKRRGSLARFELGLEDSAGNVRWVSSDGVGGLPLPFPLPVYLRADGRLFDKNKTMLKTLRFPAACFGTVRPRRGFDLASVRAILIRVDQPDGRAIAFDDLEIVSPRGAQ